MKNLAADLDFGTLRGIGPLGLEGKPDASVAMGVFSNFISSAIGLITIIAIIWFVFIFIMGAIGIISSGGDKQAMESARKKITSGVIGLVVVIAGMFVIQLIGRIIGIPEILNITKMFNVIAPSTP